MLHARLDHCSLSVMIYLPTNCLWTRHINNKNYSFGVPTKKRKYTQYHLRLKKAAGLSHWLRMYWDINQIRECDYKKDHTKINQI